MSYKAVLEARKEAERWAERVHLKEAVRLGLQLKKDRIERTNGKSNSK